MCYNLCTFPVVYRNYSSQNYDFRMKRGQYKIIFVDGTETVVNRKPTINAIAVAIGASGLDTIILSHSPPILVMFVDDTGAIDGKPANAKATGMYLARCEPGTTHQICGDVVIANDADF